ncbi:MAG: LEPR-XLL domain-containing protein, partial [Comamonadaceae bacterium]
MRAKRSSISSRLREAFRLEPLEPRVLLSADPVLGTAAAVLSPTRDNDQITADAYDSGTTLLAQQTTQASSAVVAQILRQGESRGMTEFAVDAGAFDLAKVQSQLTSLDGALVIEPGQVMGGSGTVPMDVYNDGKMSPGYSPGFQNITGN